MNSLLLEMDIGGTFTDLLMMHGDGHIVVAQTPLTPHNPRLAMERGISLPAERLGRMAADLTLAYADGRANLRDHQSWRRVQSWHRADRVAIPLLQYRTRMPGSKARVLNTSLTR